MTDYIRINPKIEKDRAPLLRFVKIYISVMGPLIIITIVGCFSDPPIISLKLFAISSLCAIPFCIFFTFLIEKIGGGLGTILSGSTSRRISRDERFSGEINKIKFSKREGRFDPALQMVNTLLHEAPDYPEAMLLKAQILWEGYGKSDTAKACLNRIRELAPEDDKFHRWATSYLKTVTEMEKKQ